MTTLRPTRYADRDNSTFFEAAGDLITISYRISQRKRLWVLRGEVVAELAAVLGGGTSSVRCEYAVPRSFAVGGEIGSVERDLYDFMDAVVRTAVQLSAIERAERAAESAESRHLYADEADASSRPDRPAASDAMRKEAPLELAELRERVVIAVAHLTNVTSLTTEGLAGYQRDRVAALERVFESTSLSGSLQVQEVLQAVESLLSHEVHAKTDVRALRELTLHYLLRLRRKQGEQVPKLTEEQAHIIANEFVPAYVELRRKYAGVASLPRDIVEHAFGSFFGGGIAGYLTLSLFAEAVIRGIAGVSLDIPGWYIGAAAAFVWPYIRGMYGLMTRDKWYERKREALIRKVNARLRLSWPDEVSPRALNR